MKSLKVSQAGQGWVLIFCGLVISALWLMPPIQDYLNANKRAEEIRLRIQSHKVRLASLPQTPIDNTAIIGIDEAGFASEIQQALSTIFRDSGGRLIELTATGRQNSPIASLTWRAVVDGDPVAVSEILTGIQARGDILIDTLVLKPTGERSSALQMQMGFRALVGQSEFFPALDISGEEFLERNPFDPNRQTFLRNQLNQPASTSPEYKLTGLRQKNGEWIGSLEIDPDQPSISVETGTVLQSGLVESVSKVGVQIQMSDGTTLILNAPFED